MKFASKLALLFGSLGLVLTIFLIIVYYMHLYFLSNSSIEVIYYTTSTYLAAITFFSLSLGIGIASMVTRSRRKSSYLMLVSAVIAFAGYVFPCKRLWTLGYLSALSETISIGIIHMTLLISSSFLLKVECKPKVYEY
jgi:uncharacterized membrane protein